jgi:hypothetical protein
MIVEYASTLRQQIYNHLLTHASKVYSSTPHKVRKNVMFNDHELHPNYSEPQQQYDGLPNNFSGLNPCRMTSVPSAPIQRYSCGVPFNPNDEE